MTKKTEVTFLGLFERADYNESQMRWNVLGLTHVIASHIYPLNLIGLGIGLSVKSIQLNQKLRICITEENGKEIGYFDLSSDSEIKSEVVNVINEVASPKIPLLTSGWFPPIFMKLGGPGIVVCNPGRCLIKIENDVIGELLFRVVDPKPLSIEKIAAIKSDPKASKAVKMILGCKKCPSKLKLYSAIEANQSLEKEGFIINTSSTDEFVCSCKNTIIDTKIIKRNLHALLGLRAREGEEISYIKMYEKSIFQRIRIEFFELLSEQNLKEEKIQKFIEKNPILLHQFVPSSDDKIIFKPRFSNKYIGDFAFVTPQKELVIIEIEPLIKLVKKMDIQPRF